MERRLTAILAADVVGYSRLMGEDEVGTLQRLKTLRRELVEPIIKELHGNIVKLMGDGALVEFASVVDAVQCAVAIQRKIIEHNQETPENQWIRFRIGVNLGDVIVDGDDIYGDGVNIAARLEGMATPDGICISGTAFDHAVHKVDVGFVELGQQHLKNIADPVRVYRVLLDPKDRQKLVAAVSPSRKRIAILAGVALVLIAISAAALLWQRSYAPQRQAIAVLPFANLSGESSQDYFADGITEDLITDLAKLSDIDVVSRNSVLAYRNRPSALTVIARDLGARFIVEGSVRRTGDQIRVTAQLIDIVTGDNLWANRYDGAITGLFTIQSQMSREIAQALGVRPSNTETERMARPPTTNLEVQRLDQRQDHSRRARRGDGHAAGEAAGEDQREHSLADAQALTRKHEGEHRHDERQQEPRAEPVAGPPRRPSARGRWPTRRWPAARTQTE